MGRFPTVRIEHAIDDKLRVVIPKIFREGFGAEQVYLHDRGDPRTLYLYPKSYINLKLNQFPSPLDPGFNPDELLRLLNVQGGLRYLEYDQNNRVIISEARVRAKDIKSLEIVTFQGVNDYVLLFLGKAREMQQYSQL